MLPVPGGLNRAAVVIIFAPITMESAQRRKTGDIEWKSRHPTDKSYPRD